MKKLVVALVVTLCIAALSIMTPVQVRATDDEHYEMYVCVATLRFFLGGEGYWNDDRTGVYIYEDCNEVAWFIEIGSSYLVLMDTSDDPPSEEVFYIAEHMNLLNARSYIHANVLTYMDENIVRDSTEPFTIQTFGTDSVYVPLRFMTQHYNTTLNVAATGITSAMGGTMGPTLLRNGSLIIVDYTQHRAAARDALDIIDDDEDDDQEESAQRILRFAIGEMTFTDNGEEYPLDAAPFIASNRTMVPLRVIIEALDATDIALAGGVVSFNIGDQSFAMTIGEELPGGWGTPVIIARRTFVPLAFVINELGATHRWDSTARAAYIYLG